MLPLLATAFHSSDQAIRNPRAVSAAAAVARAVAGSLATAMSTESIGAVIVVTLASPTRSNPVPPRIAIYPLPLLISAAYGLLIAFVFAILPLARARTVPAASLFRGAVSKDTVSRIWRKIKGDWEAWNKRDLSTEDVVRLILDGTTVRVRIDRKATTISLLIVLGVRRDGQKVLLAIRSMGGESEAAWRTVLDDLAARGLKKPDLTIVDGAPGLEKALTSLWADIPIQRCTVHKLRNLIAHAPKKLAEEIAADFSDMIYAKTAKEVATRRKAFIRKWRLRCRAVADSLEEAGDKLFTFTRLPVAQWKSVRTTNAIERLHEEFKRRIKTQTVLPSAETAAMLFWGLLASGQITMRKVDGSETLKERPTEIIDLAA